MGGGVGDEVADVLVDGDVEGAGQDLDAGFAADLAGGRFEGGFGAGAEGELRALPGQSEGDGFAEPLAGGGDQRDAVFKSEVHPFRPGAGRRRLWSASRGGSG